MNDNETTDQGTSTSLVPASGDGHDLLPASLIRGVDQFENPGLPPHVHRAADDDPAAAKRAERQVATMFGLSMLATLVFLVSYFAIPDEATFFFPGIGIAKTQNVVLGLSLGVVGVTTLIFGLVPALSASEKRSSFRYSK